MSASFRFLHAADLHLGSLLDGVATPDEALARRFAGAARAAFAALVDRTRAEGADFAVLAGDIYDGPWRDAAIGLFFVREIARLGIPVYALSGNHDAESVVSKAAIPDPPNLHRFSTARPQTHRIEALRVALHGQGFATREEPRNLVLHYPPAVPGWFNLGVLHSALTGRPGHAPYAPCTLEELRARGYDYWALGHVHGHEVVARDPWVVYPGVLQGRSVRETGAKGAVLVTVEDGRVAGIERLVTDEVRWAEATADLAGLTDPAEAEARIAALLAAQAEAAEGRPLALRLRLVGETPLAGTLRAGRAAFADRVRALCAIAAPDLCLESLRLDLAAPAAAAPGAADPALDLQALLAEAAADADFRAEAGAELARIEAALGAPLEDGLDGLLAEARALAARRAAEAGGAG